MHKLYDLKDMLCEELEEFGSRDQLSTGSLEMVDKLAHAAKNVAKLIQICEEEEEYSMDGGMSSNRSSRRASSRDGGGSSRYSGDGYYYDGGGSSRRRGRGRNGRFVSRDGSEMARKLREMMNEATDDSIKQEMQRLADKVENM